MFEVHADLIPVEEFEDARLVDAAYQLAKMTNDRAVKRQLRRRHLWTAAGAFATPQAATTTLRKAVDAAEQEKFYTYLHTTSASEVRGVGTVIPTLPLRRLRLNLPPYRLLRSVPGVVAENPVPESMGSANVTAWSGESYPTPQTFELTVMYAGLRALGRERGIDTVWTAEPTDSIVASQAIVQAGLAAVRTGHYDDAEPNRHFVGTSMLYISPSPSPEPQA